MNSDRLKEIRINCERRSYQTDTVVKELLAYIDQLHKHEEIDGIALANQQALINQLEDKIADSEVVHKHTYQALLDSEKECRELIVSLYKENLRRR